MMPLSTFVSLLLLLAISNAKETATLRGLRGGTSRGEKVGGKATDSESCLVCNVEKADVQYLEGYAGNHSDYWVCETDAADEPDGRANQIYLMEDLPKEFIKEHKKNLNNGRSRICIPSGKANRSNHKVEIPKNASPKYLGERDDKKKPERGHHRQLLKTTGTHTVLAVIVTSSVTGEADPNLNATVLAGNLFGMGPLAPNASVASQYRACSNGKLQMVPFTGRNVVNGVLSVTVPIPINKTPTLTTIQNAVIQATQTALNISDIRSQSANHVLFCLPTGGLISGSNSWVSYGFTNGVMSFYQISMCTRLSAPIHEIGHNNGFYHSGVTSDEYGDKSGYMGYAYQQTGKPQMCFNAHKNFVSGWFDDRKVMVNPLNGTWGGTILAPVDYTAAAGTFPNATVVVNVGQLYLQLNSAKKYNSDTKGNPNKVNIVSADVPSNPSAISWLVASLLPGQNYTLANYAGTGAGLVIQVCSITLGTIDTAKVSIYLNNGIQKSNCGQIV